MRSKIVNLLILEGLYLLFLTIAFLFISSMNHWGQAVGRVLAELSTGRIPTEAWTLAISTLLFAVVGPRLWSKFTETSIERFRASHLIFGAIIMTMVTWLGWLVVIFLCILGWGTFMNFQEFLRDAAEAYSNR